jgi:hypothetical protein
VNSCSDHPAAFEDEVPPEDIQSEWEAEVAEADNENYATMHAIEDDMMRDEGSSSKDHKQGHSARAPRSLQGR